MEKRIDELYKKRDSLSSNAKTSRQQVELDISKLKNQLSDMKSGLAEDKNKEKDIQEQ